MTKTLLRLYDSTPICINEPELREGVTAYGVYDKGDIVLKRGRYILDDNRYFYVGEHGEVLSVKTLSVREPNPPPQSQEPEPSPTHRPLVFRSAVDAIRALAAYVYFSDEWETNDWAGAYREAIEIYGDAKAHQPDLNAMWGKVYGKDSEDK